MIDIDKIYAKEKIINEFFKKKYDYSNLDIFNKQVLELIVELSELAYETKCFKYWKNDKPSNAETIIAEYADCLMIILCFCDLANIDIKDLKEINEKDIVKQFIKLNNLASQITIQPNKTLILEILSNLLHVSRLLNFSEKEIEKYCIVKMEKTLAMISQ